MISHLLSVIVSHTLITRVHIMGTLYFFLFVFTFVAIIIMFILEARACFINNNRLLAYKHLYYHINLISTFGF